MTLLKTNSIQFMVWTSHHNQLFNRSNLIWACQNLWWYSNKQKMTITFFDCNGSGRRLFEIGSVSEGFGQKKKLTKN